jgi:hypothetical protein
VGLGFRKESWGNRNIHIEERLTSHIYIRILEEIMVPSVRVVYPEDNFVFQEDNCSVHTAAHRVSEWFQNHDINVFDWQGLSPDLNPIECCSEKHERTPSEI